MYQLPQKIPRIIRQLEIFYRDPSLHTLHEIVLTSSIYIKESTAYDNWNGGTTGHQIVFFAQEIIFEKIKNLETQQEILGHLKSDINKCVGAVSDEYIDSIYLELFDENSNECKLAIKPFKQITVNPDSLNIWKPGYLRLFISHRDEFKKEANQLAIALEEYGVSSFVAHDTIEPMAEWQHEIIKALFSMEVMLTFITDNFSDSHWTNQEIGVAIGRGIPIIPVKLQEKDPHAFISSIQAIRGDISNPQKSAETIYKVLIDKLNQENRIKKSVLQAFLTVNEFKDVPSRFKKLQQIKTITDSDIQSIIDGFANNYYLYNAIYLINDRNRLTNFLESRSGKKYKIAGKNIRAIDSPAVIA